MLKYNIDIQPLKWEEWITSYIYTKELPNWETFEVKYILNWSCSDKWWEKAQENCILVCEHKYDKHILDNKL